VASIYKEEIRSKKTESRTRMFIELRKNQDEIDGINFDYFNLILILTFDVSRDFEVL